MNNLVYVGDTIKDVSKVNDYLKVGSPHHIRSYFWWCGGGGEIEIEHLQKERGIEIEKTLKK